MKLSDELISKFVKITNDEPQKKTETVVYATAKGSDSVQIDGSDTVIKIDNQSATRMKDGDRVTVMIKNHTAVATGNLSDASGVGSVVDGKADNKDLNELKGEHNTIVNSVNANTADIGTLKSDVAKINKASIIEATIEYLEANHASIDFISSIISKTSILEADVAEIDKLTVDLVNVDTGIIQDLEVERGRINDLEAEDVKINGRIDANEASIKDLVAADATINNLVASKADIARLEAVEGNISTLTSDVADIDTLIFGSASGSTIQTSFANAVIAQLGNAQIKSAMIESVSAEKITAGDIITNNVQVKSNDGRLLISDETLQINDGTHVRVQIGKDASNDYSINVYDQNGVLMFSKGGITDAAIKDAIIRNDMVSENANIHASKLNIDSLFEEINSSSKTIKATKVELDETGQKLDVAFTELTTELSDLDETISSQGTAISVLQGQVSSKIWQQDINDAKNDVVKDLESDITNLSTKYSEIKQTVNGMSTTISNHETEISNKADSTTVTTVINNVSSLEQNVNGFKTEVSSTYATKNAVEEVMSSAELANERVNETKSLIEVLSESISILVTDSNGASLMKQTEDGWTFSTGDIQNLANTTSENLDLLTKEVGDVESAVDILQQAVNDLGAIAEYVKIGTYENEPCVELGENDSDFKLLITNTRMVFAEGPNVLAYFNNQSLHIKKAVVEDEFQQGGFVWKVRNNGNLGLTWKGGNG